MNINRFVEFWSFLVMISCAIVGCSNNFNKSTSLRPTITPQPGADPKQINVNTEANNWMQLMAESNPGGLALGIDPSYRASYLGWGYTFYKSFQEPLIAQVTVFNGDLQSRNIILICLLDHVQIPCQPNTTKAQALTVKAGTQQLVPIQLIDLSVGLHDFDVLAVRDPYVDIEANDLESRTFMLSVYYPTNILVNGSLHPPTILTIIPLTRPAIENDELFSVASNAELFDKPDFIPYWLDAEGNAGEMLNFNLHFTGTENAGGGTIALMAFMNYEQVPLYFEGVPYKPLYIQRESNTWQTAPVQLQLPDKPGVYELYIAGRSDIFHLQGENDGIGTGHSHRIRIKVK